MLTGRDRFDLIRLEPIDSGDDVAPEWVEWIMVPVREREGVSAALRDAADAWDAALEGARRHLEESSS